MSFQKECSCRFLGDEDGCMHKPIVSIIWKDNFYPWRIEKMGFFLHQLDWDILRATKVARTRVKILMLKMFGGSIGALRYYRLLVGRKTKGPHRLLFPSYMLEIITLIEMKLSIPRAHKHDPGFRAYITRKTRNDVSTILAYYRKNYNMHGLRK